MSVTTERRAASVPPDVRRLPRALAEAAASRWPGVPVFTLIRRAILIALTLAIITVLLLLPLLLIFTEALSHGWRAASAALAAPEAWAAIRLTLTVAAIAVPVNAVFGTAAAWCIGRFRFPGRTLLMTLIELPFSVSPVISGLVWVLLFGANGFLGPWLDRHGIRIIFTLPGLVLATLFVTFPFVARSLIPLMQDQGAAEEEAALTLGATGWQIFTRITLPNIIWALLYGVLLCNARAMGEFGAVAVVSGHIRGQTLTMPLYVEALFNDYDWVGAFTVAALLAMLAVVTLVLKLALEWRMGRRS
jgi:sulfate/thiosulfate transport system permease protein